MTTWKCNMTDVKHKIIEKNGKYIVQAFECKHSVVSIVK